MKILLTGGSGTLGSELNKLLQQTNHEIFVPSSKDMDIRNYSCVNNTFNTVQPELVVHCAAYTDVKQAEKNYIDCIDVNILGTLNILKSCNIYNTKLIFISTEHVFDGEKGNYNKSDYINPITKYAKSKASAELMCKMYDNCLIIRTSFYGHVFPYEHAFIDQWSTKDYVDIIAPKVLKFILSDKTGIVHCGSEKRTIFDLAKTRKNDVKPFSRNDLQFPTPKDTSLIIEKE